jgi:hypothetical protein
LKDTYQDSHIIPRLRDGLGIRIIAFFRCSCHATSHCFKPAMHYKFVRSLKKISLCLSSSHHYVVPRLQALLNKGNIEITQKSLKLFSNIMDVLRQLILKARGIREYLTSSLRAELHSRITNSYLEFTCINAVLIFLIMSLFASTIRRSSRTLLNQSTPRVRTRPQDHSTSELTSDSPHYPAQCISNRSRCV